MPAQEGETPDLIEMLDLERPELQAVREAVRKGDRQAALKAFAAHLRSRKTPRWFIDPDAPPKDLSDAAREWADMAMQHEFVSVGIRHRFGDKIDWAYNPTTQPGSPYAPDHEWTWQLNRHGAWTCLAAAYNATGDARYARELAQQIRDWIRDNPPPQGRALQAPYSRWRTIEAGLRMANAWPEIYHRLIRHPEVFPDDVLLAMVRCMAQHAAYLDAFPTGGNWLCMEANGLFHVGVLFPEFKDAARWREHALERLRREIDAQVYPDGAQIELTPGYHHVSLHNFVRTLELARLNAIPLPSGYQEGLERMYDLFLRLMTPDRDVPPFNDSWSVDVPEVLTEGFRLFPSRSDYQWIATDGKAGKPPAFTSHLFPYAGWAVMRTGWDRQAHYLVMDAGPFGFGHQHEDKLSFVLYAFGRRMIFDAGSYAYDASEMRRYVISARGHNVIHVDGLEQFRRGGPRDGYVVKAPVCVVWRSERSRDYAAASYGSLPEENWGPEKKRHVVHIRRVLFVKPDFWILCDTLKPADDATHRYESTFHLDAPEAQVDAENLSVTVEKEDVAFRILPLKVPGLSVRIIQGQTEPFVQGWLPKRHGRTGADPRPCAYYTLERSGPAHYVLVLMPARKGKPFPVCALDSMQETGGELTARLVLTSGRSLRLRVLADGGMELDRFRAPAV